MPYRHCKACLFGKDHEGHSSAPYAQTERYLNDAARATLQAVHRFNGVDADCAGMWILMSAQKLTPSGSLLESKSQQKR